MKPVCLEPVNRLSLEVVSLTEGGSASVGACANACLCCVFCSDEE